MNAYGSTVVNKRQSRRPTSCPDRICSEPTLKPQIDTCWETTPTSTIKSAGGNFLDSLSKANSCSDRCRDQGYSSSYDMNSRGEPHKGPPYTIMDILLDVETCDVDIDYKPLPDDVQHMINRLCSKHEVQYAVWSQSPFDWKKISINGIGATKIQEDLTKEERFSEFTFKLRESGPLHTKQYRNDLLSVQHKSTGEVAPEWRDVATVTCDLLVTGEERNKDNPQRRGEALFAVIPAHLLINEAQCENFLDNGTGVKEIREYVDSQASYHRFVLRGSENTIDLKQPAMIAYRHYYKNINRPTAEDSDNWRCSEGKCKISDLPCLHECMNDIALLPIEPEEARRLKELIANNADTYRNIDYDDIIALEPTKMEQEFLERRPQLIFYAGNYPCRMVPTHKPGDTSTPSKTYTSHISFVTINEQHTLNEGDSGTILYLLASGRRYALAKMTGVRTHNDDPRPIYHAILLKQALRDIEMDYPHHVDSLKPFKIYVQPQP